MTVWLIAYLGSKMNLTEKEIINMPFYKVLLYSHALQVLDGAETTWSNADASTPKLDLDSLDTFIEEELNG